MQKSQHPFAGLKCTAGLQGWQRAARWRRSARRGLWPRPPCPPPASCAACGSCAASPQLTPWPSRQCSLHSQWNDLQHAKHTSVKAHTEGVSEGGLLRVHRLLRRARVVPRGAIRVRAPFFPISAARRCCCCCLHSTATGVSQEWGVTF